MPLRKSPAVESREAGRATWRACDERPRREGVPGGGVAETRRAVPVWRRDEDAKGQDASEHTKTCQSMQRRVKKCQDTSRHIKTRLDLRRYAAKWPGNPDSPVGFKSCQDASRCIKTSQNLPATSPGRQRSANALRCSWACRGTFETPGRAHAASTRVKSADRTRGSSSRLARMCRSSPRPYPILLSCSNGIRHRHSRAIWKVVRTPCARQTDLPELATGAGEVQSNISGIMGVGGPAAYNRSNIP